MPEMKKRKIMDIKYFEVEVPADMPEEDIVEAYNFGDIKSEEIDGRLELLSDD